VSFEGSPIYFMLHSYHGLLLYFILEKHSFSVFRTTN